MEQEVITEVVAPVIEEQVNEEPLSRREQLEAAFDDAEAAGEETPVVKAVEAVAEAKPATEEAKPVAAPAPEDGAPSSWKEGPKKKWATLDPEVRQEVIRRERDAIQALTNSDSARKFAATMSNAIGPHGARLAALGIQPDAAVSALLRTDMVLSSGAPAMRAQTIAKLIKDYGVDISLLDQALSGQNITQADPVMDRLTSLLDQRLAPVNQFLTQQQQVTRQAEQQAEQQLISEVDKMEADVENYPFFNQVRDSMADLLQIFAQKNAPLTLQAAYNKAVRMNDTLSAQTQARDASEVARLAAAARTARAAKARSASLSVASSGTGQPKANVNPSDRRGTIMAAFEALEGR